MENHSLNEDTARQNANNNQQNAVKPMDLYSFSKNTALQIPNNHQQKQSKTDGISVIQWGHCTAEC